MLTHVGLLETPSLRIAAVRCGGGRAWSPEEQVRSTSIVLVRRGAFRRRVGDTWSLADTTAGYVQRPGECQQIAHPAGGDVCTSIGVPDELGERLARAGPLFVSAAADLAHRRLVTTAERERDRVDLADRAVELLDLLLPAARPVPLPARARRLVDQARTALNATPDVTLDELAGAIGWSPWYLSRMFHRVTGGTLGAYRRRLRVRAALDALAEGDGSPAEIAARTGFADQAHLTRAVRREIGIPPAAARRHLRAG